MGVNPEIYVDIQTDKRDAKQISVSTSVVEVLKTELIEVETNETTYIVEVFKRSGDAIEVTKDVSLLSLSRGGDGGSVYLVQDVIAVLSNIIDTLSAGTVVDFDPAWLEPLLIDNQQYNETPNGPVNGTNTIFYTNFPYRPLSTRVFINGLRQVDPDNYLETGANQITLSEAPMPGDEIIVDYIKV